MDSDPLKGYPTTGDAQRSTPHRSLTSLVPRIFVAIFIINLFVRLLLLFLRRSRYRPAEDSLLLADTDTETDRRPHLAPFLIAAERDEEVAATYEPEQEQEFQFEVVPEDFSEGEITFSVAPGEPAVEPPVSFALTLDEPAPPPPVSFALSVDETFSEAPVSFDVFQETAPDLDYFDPTLLLVESAEPKYRFNWQNPVLQKDIYPFRIEKLVDFLAFYTEIELCKAYRAKGIADPDIQAKIQRSALDLRRARQEVLDKLNRGIEAKKQSDPYFAKITAQNEKNLRFKQKYYLDREIQRLEDKLGDLEDQKATLLKRVNWYPEGDPRRDVWRERASGLDPQIAEIKTELGGVKSFRDLFDQEAQLPNFETQKVSIEDVIRWELREKREQWEKKSQEALLAEMIDQWFQRDPDRFPEWLVYMVIHFSGMRYMSSHGSWAEPRFLLELLMREDLESETNDYDAGRLASACNQAVQELQREIHPLLDEPRKKFLNDLIRRLQTAAIQKRALLEYRTTRVIEEIQNLPDDEACLNRLVQYRQEKEASGEPIPPWVWHEIVKYTPLRLQTDNPDWDTSSPERWQWSNEPWQAILSTWQKKDITAWRKKHRDSLELVVTRAVCNEIAEHIQHLRGLAPGAGLTAKPLWYLRQAEKDPQRAYFKQAPAEEDFKTGASILWLEWVDKQPNAWQVARSLPGFTFFPGQASKPQRGQKGELRKADIDKDWDTIGGWRHQQMGSSFIRTRRKPSPQELKKQGKTEHELKKILADRRVSGEVDKQYLRWRHEASVIDVVDMVDGRYVLTFETGKIGVILRRLSDLRGNPMVFAGYVSPAAGLPPQLDRQLTEMLRWDQILPGAGLPARTRPRRKEADNTQVEEVSEVQTPPQREVLVIRENTRSWKISTYDKQGRPKMIAASPPLQFKRGTRLNVSKTHKASPHDAGDGVIKALDGLYLQITGYSEAQRGVGLFVRREDVADYHSGKWVRVSPTLARINPQVLKGRDLKGKPYFEPTPLAARVQIPAGITFRVSSSHTESNKDSGDGTILSSGLQAYYLVLECAAVPQAEGLYVEKEEVVEVQ